MAQNLKEYLAERKCQGFKPVPHYFANGDFVTYYLSDERCYAQRVDDLLTVYLSMQTHELAGCKIKGVRHILQTAGDFGVTIDGKDVRLGLFFFIGAAMAKDETQKRRYEQLRQIAKDAIVNRHELQANSLLVTQAI